MLIGFCTCVCEVSVASPNQIWPCPFKASAVPAKQYPKPQQLLALQVAMTK